MLQTTALPFVKFPVILSQDIAGTVEAVTPGSTASHKFTIGDRVFGFTAGNNGFQDYVSIDCGLIAKIPNDIPYRDAVVFGLCVTTSSFSLFGKDFLGLEFPKIGPPQKGKMLLVWGVARLRGATLFRWLRGRVTMLLLGRYFTLCTCFPKPNTNMT